MKRQQAARHGLANRAAPDGYKPGRHATIRIARGAIHIFPVQAAAASAPARWRTGERTCESHWEATAPGRR